MLSSQQQMLLTYIQVIIALFVFGVGLPALIFDRPAWLRRIRERNSRFFRYRNVIAISLALIALVLVGYFIPPPPFIQCITNKEGGLLYEFCRTRNWLRANPNLVGSLLVIIAIVLTGIQWIWLRGYSFYYVLQRIENKTDKGYFRQLISRIESLRLPFFQIRHIGERIHDIGVLGRNTNIQADKTAVLSALERISTRIQLEASELNIIVEAVLNTLYKADVGNYIIAMRVFQSIITRIDNESSFSYQVLHTNLARLGDRALRLGVNSDAVTNHLMTCIETIPLPHRSRPYYSLGRSSINSRNLASSIMFISALEALVFRFHDSAEVRAVIEQGAAKETTILYIGLIAHFFALGDFTREEILKRYLRVSAITGYSLSENLDSIIMYFAELAEYDTVTAVRLFELAIRSNQQLTHRSYLSRLINQILCPCNP